MGFSLPTGIIGDIGGLVGSFMTAKAQKQQNKRAKEQLAIDKSLADQQIDISKYIQSLSQALMGQGSTQIDPYGGMTYYDPNKKAYVSTLGPKQQALQDASDAEEMRRLQIDQYARRGALQDIEGNRQQAGGAERDALRRAGLFREGVGAVDAGNLASQIRLNREGAVNAGYDDTERAARTLQLRTGSSAVTDALGGLARDRVRSLASIGDPETEALGAAQDINSSRYGAITNDYGVFGNRASVMPDTTFTPAPYSGIADAKLADQMKFDLSKYEVAQGGSAGAAAGIGSAAAGLRQGYAATEANRILSPTGQAIAAGGQTIDSIISKLFPMGG
jgi:hypothetical protein